MFPKDFRRTAEKVVAKKIKVLRPWYFRDGTPIRKDVIAKIVDAAKLHTLKPPVGLLQYPPSAPEDLIRETASYFARQMERNLTCALLKVFNSLHHHRLRLSGDASLDAKRLWRREYQKVYRLRNLAKSPS